MTTMRERFKTGNYREVVQIADTIRYPENITPSLQRMIEIAKKHSTDKGTSELTRDLKHNGVIGESASRNIRAGFTKLPRLRSIGPNFVPTASAVRFCIETL